jgi:hypothetical protein
VWLEPAGTDPVFRTELVTLNVDPIGAVPGGFVSELTTRFGTCWTVMVPVDRVQLLFSFASRKLFGPSAHASRKYVAGTVSE